MSGRTGINPQHLVATAMGALKDHRLPAAEELVLGALDPRIEKMLPPDLLLDAERLVIPRVLALTGSIFVFEYEDLVGISGGVQEVLHDPTLTTFELPPLPFARCWFEWWSTEQGRPIGSSYTDWAGDDMALLAIGIWEVEPFSEWICYGIARPQATSTIETFRWRLITRGHSEFPEGADDQALMSLRLDPNIVRLMETMSSEIDLTYLWFMPVVLVNAIHVLGGRHEAVPVIRQLRRDHQRRHGVEHPQIYFVDLRATGDEVGGHGTREYRHRWLVRGHYRRSDAGRFNVPYRGLCTWVRPYVKGPVGAPWKGRPVHIA